MEQKEPIKITLVLILRWILGIFFLLFFASRFRDGIGGTNILPRCL